MSINYELYDRQIRTFGEEATIKLNASSVCIIGLNKGLATEISKNLALCGIKNLYLLDKNVITKNDLLTGYYYTDEDIGKLYSEVLVEKIQDLNPFIKVTALISDDQLILSEIIICVNQLFETDIYYDSYCKDNNKKFISLHSANNSGIIFVNAGNEYLVKNITGENYEPVQVTSISDQGIVKTTSHNFQSGDTIIFSNLEGSGLEQFNKEFQIEVINNYTFKLLFNLVGFKFINGTVNYVDKTTTINHNSLEVELKNPTMNFMSDPDIIKKFINNEINFDIELVPVNSIMGSLVASEAIKLVTNKYQPISQWFTWSDPDLDIEISKLSNTEFFIVGSGAIGCELLKNLAFLDIKHIVITDPDTIEKSNLSRQFLFRPSDVGKLKSEVAANSIRKMKPSIKITNYSEKVGDTINFTNKILSNPQLTGVFNALDNISARKFMDSQCFNYNLPLFESGTTGIKGNTQPVIPFITETYSNSNDPENEKSFPICTIKNFPNEIHHTIHWAMDNFEFFNRAPININKWLENKKLMNFDNSYEGTQANNDIYLFTTKYNVSCWQDCVKWAIDMFYENYRNQIYQLLNNFPPDLLTEDGNPFWSAGKKCPVPLELDYTNQTHLDFIESTTIILSNCVGLNSQIIINELIDIIKSYKVDDFSVNEKLVIAANDSELEKEKTNSIELYNLKVDTNVNMAISQVLDKDDDSNYHIKWITSASNLRAANYSINQANFYTTKGIAGRIIPAVSTTTSIVAGLIVIEMIKYLTKPGINKYKSTFINLALNTFVSAEPIEAPLIKVGDQTFNSWYKFIHTEDCTLKNFIKKYNALFNINISMISYENSILYVDFIGSYDDNKLLSKILITHDENIDLSNLSLTITPNEDVEIPNIMIKF